MPYETPDQGARCSAGFARRGEADSGKEIDRRQGPRVGVAQVMFGIPLVRHRSNRYCH